MPTTQDTQAPLELTPDKIHVIRGALELARDQYISNAKGCRTYPKGQYEKLAQRFDQQAEDAAKILEEIDR